jgi:microcystin-dependent protein
LIPDSEDWVAAVTGAILNMTFVSAWEQYGTLTPTQCAERMMEMLDDFTFQKGRCRVIGEIIAYAGSTSPIPSAWLLADGSSVLRTDYPDLFAVIGTAYGAVDVSHFNLPDLRGYTLIGQGSGYTLATPVGEAQHTLTVAETPSHSHTDTGHAHTEITAIAAVGAAITGVPVPSAVPSVGVTGSAAAALTSTGGDGAHNNIQPSMPITYLIVAKDR